MKGHDTGRSTKTGALAPVTRDGFGGRLIAGQRSTKPGAPAPVTPGQHPPGHRRRPGRSTKAGALPPVTPDLGAGPLLPRGRSTKTGALAPVTPSSPRWVTKEGVGG